MILDKPTQRLFKGQGLFQQGESSWPKEKRWLGSQEEEKDERPLEEIIEEERA